MKRHLFTPAIVAALALAGWATAANAAQVTFTGNYAGLNGTGNGPIQGVLSLQEQGNDTFEYGYSGWSSPGGVGGNLVNAVPGTASESWSSSSSQVHKATNSAGYFAQSVGTLATAGINGSNLALAFQVNVSGSTVTMSIRKFEVVFIRANGTEVGRLTYTPTGNALSGTSTIASDPTLISKGTAQTTDNGVLPGVGQGSSGWLYTLDLSSILAIEPNFFSNSNNRIGMNVDQYVLNQAGGQIYNFQPVDDGSDNFFFTTATTPPPVPVPAAAWTGLSALAGLGVFGKLRKKLNRN